MVGSNLAIEVNTNLDVQGDDDDDDDHVFDVANVCDDDTVPE